MMKRKVIRRMKKFMSCNVSCGRSSIKPLDMDVREEYAHAFRTESYNDFWTRVLTISQNDSASVECSTSARLPSYRLFTENLLDPDQPTTTRILKLVQKQTRSLLSEYFCETSNASFFYSLLLKDIDHARDKCRSFKTILQLIGVTKNLEITNGIIEFSNYTNPFASSAPSPSRVRVIQAGCKNLLKRLETRREKIRNKLRLIYQLKNSSGILLVAITASLTAIIASHAVALLVAAPCLMTASFEWGSVEKLIKESAQLDTAAKGTYILNRDLDTMSRLVARLNDEIQHMCDMVKFWLTRGDDQLKAGFEVASQLNRSDDCINRQLDELEEHIYLCFMTVNRSRNLVVQEI